MKQKYLLILITIGLGENILAQQQVTSIATINSSASATSYSNVKGAGLRNSGGTLSSSWDSTGTAFNVNFSTTANNITSVSQITVSGHTRSIIPLTLNATVKVRRLANNYVPDTRNYYNYWTATNSIPAAAATTGTFNIIAPEITSPEAAFLTNNLNSGYDNIFQNTIGHLHANNIERVDYIFPPGLKGNAQLDLDGTGALIIDRGTGDAFKIATILSVDNNNDPLTYGPLITVLSTHFGPDLLGSPFNFCIFTQDPKYGLVSRPSTSQSQNKRGVFISLSDMGVVLNQTFYGYSIFGADVPAAIPDWTIYPNNSDSSSQLDPANVFSFFKDVNSILPVPSIFNLSLSGNKPVLQITVNNIDDEAISIERSINGRDFTEIGRQFITRTPAFDFQDDHPIDGLAYYRICFLKNNERSFYSDIKSIRLEAQNSLILYPNPAKEVINISLPAEWIHHKIKAILYNASGINVRQDSFLAVPNKQFSLQNLNSGNYFLSLVNEDKKHSEIKSFSVIK